MRTYGSGVSDIGNAITMSGYVAMASLATALDEISGDITTDYAIVDSTDILPQ